VKIFEDIISASKVKSSDRVGLKEMKKFLDINTDVKNILILEISRLGRRTNEVLNIVQYYVDKGVNIHIEKPEISTLKSDGSKSQEASIFISLFGAMAQNEAEQMGQRIKSGIMSKAKKNLVFGGKIIGYKKGENGTPIIDKEQAPIIKRIFELASEGLGMRNVSALIEKEFNKKIPIGTLSGIIRNTFHKGDRKYKDLVLQVPPIVTEEIWQKANKSIDSRGKFGSRNYVHPNIIQGKITCGECCSVMHQKVIISARLDLFVCKKDDCRNSINRQWLFRMIRLVVEKHAKKNKDEQVREKYRLLISSTKAVIEVNKRELEKLKKRRLNARIMYIEEEDFSKDDYNEIKKMTIQNIELLEKDNLKRNDDINKFSKLLNSPISHFSKDLTLFKEEIKDIINNVTIYRSNIIINLLGFRSYDLEKPNSTRLGWEARKPENERYLNEKLPLRHPIEDSELEIMINSHIAESEGLVEEYLNSVEYKEKGAGLGSK